MSIVEITIKNRIAIAPADAELICNNPTDTIKFLFDEEWADINAKTARFSWEGRYVEVPFVGNEVTVPEIYQTNYVHVGVYADEIASTPAKVKCKYSIKCLGGKVAPPAPDVYAQLLSMINELQDGADGDDGISCTHSWNGTVLTVTSASGTSSADLKGAKGDTGSKGDTGATGSPGKDGAAGKDGSDGYSPTVSVSKSGTKTTISITDKNGTKTATINDGTNGTNGTDGKDGAAGATKEEVIANLPRETWTFTLADGSTVQKVVPKLS